MKEKLRDVLLVYLLWILQRENQVKLYTLNMVGFFFILEMKVVFTKFRGYCMEFPKTSFLTCFHTCRFTGNYQKTDCGQMILKVGDGYTSKVYIYQSYELRIALWVSEWGLRWRLEIFLTHTGAWYTLFSSIYTPLLRYFLVMATFEIFHHKKFVVENYAIPNFGISTVISDPIDIFRRWCNFGQLQGQVK